MVNRLWELLTDEDIKPVRSRAEAIRTIASVIAMCCTVGSFIILIAVHVL